MLLTMFHSKANVDVQCPQAKQARHVKVMEDNILNDQAVKVIQRSWRRHKQKHKIQQASLIIDKNTKFTDVYLQQVGINYRLERFVTDGGIGSQEKKPQPFLHFFASFKGIMKFKNNLKQRCEKKEGSSVQKKYVLASLPKEKIDYRNILLEQGEELKQLDKNYQDYSEMITQAEQFQQRQFKQLFSVI